MKEIRIYEAKDVINSSVVLLGDHKSAVETMQKKIDGLEKENKELKEALDLINKDIFGTLGRSLDYDRYFKIRELCVRHFRPSEGIKK